MDMHLPESLRRYVEEHAGPVSPLLEELERETWRRTRNAGMLIGRTEGALLRMLAALSGARRAVEIGTFTGYSALMLAEGLPADGELVTCEISEEYAAIARGYFLRSPHGSKIRLVLGPAAATLSRLGDQGADFVFIDADKESYLLYYEESLRILRPGGLIAADNVLWHGSVLSPEDAESRAIAAFNARVKDDRRVERVMLPVRDGVLLIRKR